MARTRLWYVGALFGLSSPEQPPACGRPLRIAAGLPVALLLLGSAAAAATYRICPDGSGDFPDIQAAINAASEGDVIALCDGTFAGSGNRDLRFCGKAITIRSESLDPGTCRLECGGSPGAPHRGFVFQGAEGPGSIVEGITIQGGDAQTGGAANLGSTSPTFRSCVFLANNAHISGGAIDGWGSNAHFQDCTFEANTVGSYGGGASFSYSSPVFESCTFAGNLAGDIGGGLVASQEASLVLTNCLFRDNRADQGGGFGCWANTEATFAGCTFVRNAADAALAREGGAVFTQQSTIRLSRCTLVANRALHGSGLYLEGWAEDQAIMDRCIVAWGEDGPAVECVDASTEVSLVCCDLFGNQGDWVGCVAGQAEENGNLHADPLFCSPWSGDFTLRSDSPCAPQEGSTCGQIGAWPVSCDAPVLIVPVSWGRVKAAFR